jgi:DNA-directed RNA polymerase specialized sigma24 family protein
VTAAPLGTVKSRLFLALKKLKTELSVRGLSYE